MIYDRLHKDFRLELKTVMSQIIFKILRMGLCFGAIPTSMLLPPNSIALFGSAQQQHDVCMGPEGSGQNPNNF